MILAKRPPDPPPVTLRHLWYAQSIGAEHHRSFADLIGCVPRQLYGMTETVAIVTCEVHQPYTNGDHRATDRRPRHRHRRPQLR